MIKFYESYDIILDRTMFRLDVFPKGSKDMSYALFTDDMDSKQIAQTLRSLADRLDADTGTDKSG
jgi:hypothetical protein